MSNATRCFPPSRWLPARRQCPHADCKARCIGKDNSYVKQLTQLHRELRPITVQHTFTTKSAIPPTALGYMRNSAPGDVPISGGRRKPPELELGPGEPTPGLAIHVERHAMPTALAGCRRRQWGCQQFIGFKRMRAASESTPSPLELEDQSFRRRQASVRRQCYSRPPQALAAPASA